MNKNKESIITLFKKKVLVNNKIKKPKLQNALKLILFFVNLWATIIKFRKKEEEEAVKEFVCFCF